MGRAPLGGTRRCVHGRAAERVDEDHGPTGQFDQAGGLCRHQIRDLQTSDCQRPCERRRVHPVGGGGDQHRLAGCIAKLLDPAPERPPDCRAVAAVGVDRRGPLRGRRLRQLQQRQRVACGQLDDPIGLASHQRLGQRSGGTGAQRCQLDRREPPAVERRTLDIADRYQESDALCVQAAADEAKRLGRRGIEPLGVVDHGEHGALLCRCCEQARACRRRRSGGRV